MTSEDDRECPKCGAFLQVIAGPEIMSIHHVLRGCIQTGKHHITLAEISHKLPEMAQEQFQESHREISAKD